MRDVIQWVLGVDGTCKVGVFGFAHGRREIKYTQLLLVGCVRMAKSMGLFGLVREKYEKKVCSLLAEAAVSFSSLMFGVLSLME